jgi:hypothetical protein
MGLFTEDRPRLHHYLFPHRELPAVARRFAGALPELLSSGRMDTALVGMRDRVGSRLPVTERLSHARDGPRTVLCRWDDRSHVNLADGPPAEASAFRLAVLSRLGGSEWLPCHDRAGGPASLKEFQETVSDRGRGVRSRGERPSAMGAPNHRR